MPKRKSAAAVAARPPEDEHEVAIGPKGELLTDEDDQLDPVTVEEFRAQLDPGIVTNAVCWLYRQRPKVRARGKKKHIDTYDLRTFSWDQVEEDHGGGKYKLWVDIGDKVEHTFYFDSPRPAIIPPDFILLDEQGNVVLTSNPPPAANPADKPATRSDVVDIIREVKSGPDASSVLQSTVNTSVEMLGSVYKKGLEVVSQGKPAGDSSAVEDLRRQLASLEQKLNDQTTRELKDQIARLEAKIEQSASVRPQANPDGDLSSAVAKTASFFGIEGGGKGLIETLSSKGGSEESLLTYGGKKLFDAAATFIANMDPGAITNWMQGSAYNRFLEIDLRRRQQGITDTPPPPGYAPQGPQPVQRYAPQPAMNRAPVNAAPMTATPPAGGQMPNPQQTLAILQQQIPAMIRYFWDSDRDGETTALAVKGQFMPFLPMLRQQFGDLDGLRKLAATHPLLAPMTEHPDWPEWSEEFFKELHFKRPIETGEVTGPETEEEAPPPASEVKPN